MKRMTQHEIDAVVADLTAGLRPNEGIFVRRGWAMGPDAVEKCVITNPDTIPTRKQYGWELVQTGKPEVAKPAPPPSRMHQVIEDSPLKGPKPAQVIEDNPPKAKPGRKPKGNALVGNK